LDGLKLNNMKAFELFYDFCGSFEDMLKSDYKKSKAKDKGITYPQFCISVFANFMETGKELFNIKTKKK